MEQKAMLVPLAIISLLAAYPASAAIGLDRTRVVVEGGAKATTVNIRNESTTLPYLAQGWIEDETGKKIQSPLMVIPPLQRMEPDSRGQVKIQSLPATTQLPQDRESLFYFNLREVPPKTDQANSLQLALQTRVKLFYRPKALAIDSNIPVPQLKLTLKKQSDKFVLVNPTPYYITIASAGKSADNLLNDFEPVMVAPLSEAGLKLTTAQVGNTPVLSYINDFGGRPQLQFNCVGDTCSAKEVAIK